MSEQYDKLGSDGESSQGGGGYGGRWGYEEGYGQEFSLRDMKYRRRQRNYHDIDNNYYHHQQQQNTYAPSSSRSRSSTRSQKVSDGFILFFVLL